MTFTILGDTLLPLGSVKLGRLVLNAKAPLDDFYDQPTTPTPLAQDQKNFELIQKNSKYSKLRAHVSRLLYMNYEDQHKDAAALTGTKAKTYKLENSGEWFREACKTTETRKWLEGAIEDGSSVYLVIGYHTIFDPQFHVKEGMVVNQALGGTATSPSPTPTPTEPGGAGFDTIRDASSKNYVTITTLGEQIYAVQYRKLEFKGFSSRTLDKLTLERGNRWKVFWGLRGVEDTGDDDVVEANLSDELPDEESEECCEVGDDNERFLF
ncbi:hypothetical protein L873DRAFT_1686870 [Choiromyces venosus 120613-1]|uniref:Uncharacterized protein n=1 Tax=Choiromyces venosus 120613-1 TaxID=1336337 RepID=A0A3N4JK16_9PEZI|nr:hypothetical protein L873DRAFT_1686870 [Choiromyces venosus 120613-1]